MRNIDREQWKLCAVMIKNKLVKFHDYKVSNHGRVKRITENNCKTSYVGMILEGILLKGYRCVSLGPSNGSSSRLHIVRVHRLVAHAFLGACPKDKQVNHKDGNKLNNYISNLEYVTSKGNIRHAWRTGLSKSCNKLLKDEEALIVKKLLNRRNPVSYERIAKIFNVPIGVIKGIKANKTYIDVGGEVNLVDYRKFRQAHHPDTLGKLTEKQAKEIKILYEDNSYKGFCKDIAKQFKVSPLTISRIVNNHTWKYVTI